MKLQPISVAAPGFYGLNKQQSAASLDANWAIEAYNAVIDDSGRIAARKGYTQETDSPIAGTPDIEQLHEYRMDDGTTSIIAAANSKIYESTDSGATLTDKTGSLSITNNAWQFNNFNANVIGHQDGEDPVIYTGTGNFTPLHSEIDDWAASTAYAVGDVVKAVSSPDSTIYFHCTSAGTSDSTEPTWDTTVGNTTADNTVTWTTREFPRGDAAIAAYGRIWTTDSTKTVVHYSDLLLGHKYSGGSSGSIDLKSVWTHGMDQIVAFGAFNGHIIIFGKRSITIYSSADDVSNIALVEVIKSDGCIARDSVQDTGTDLIFLSATGVRSLQRTIQEKSMPLNDVSKNVRDYLTTLVKNETKSQIRSAYSEFNGFYILVLPSAMLVFCFDMRFPLKDGAARVTTWNAIEPKSLLATVDDELYIGKAGLIGKYSGYNDNADTYVLTYRSAWNNMNNTQIKIPKKMRVTVIGGYGYTINFKWAFDYAYIKSTLGGGVDSQLAAEWSEAEWNVGEWSGGSTLATSEIHMTGSGEVLQFGWNVTINGQSISFQKVDIFIKAGRINR